VIVGAFLTQNTSWTNVEQALYALRTARALSPGGIRHMPLARLESLIRPSGYFRQKARRLKTFVSFLDQSYGGSLGHMFAQPTNKLRQELLALNGVGPETADSILLYAGQHAVFVVDAYTRRILDRHGLLPADIGYEAIRSLVEDSLASLSQTDSETPERGNRDFETKPPGAAHRPSPMSLAKRSALAQVYNDMHALVVGVGKNYCLKSEPRCRTCPLQRFLS
jgi:endonuclease-3 related protein